MTSQPEPDVALLILGAVRVTIWLIGIYIALNVCPILKWAGRLLFVGFVTAALSSLAFALANGGVVQSDLVFTVAAITSLPASALIVTGLGLIVAYLVRLRRHLGRGDGFVS